MDAMSKFFTYKISTCCGIPEITLVGSKNDWNGLKTRVQKLIAMNKDDCLGLAFWLNELEQTVDKICEAAVDKKIDKEFWSNIFKRSGGGSGGPYLSGWSLHFYPYIEMEFQDSRYKNNFGDITPAQIPKAVSVVKFNWSYFGKLIPMKFYGGAFGAKYNEKENCYETKYFWAIAESDEKPKQEVKIIPSENSEKNK